MKQFITILTAGIVLASCSKSSIRGSGPIVSESRNVPAFTSVRLDGSRKVNITYGTTTTVKVTGYQNLVAIYETNVTNGTLVVKHRNDYYNVSNNNIVVDITIPSLSGVSVNGSGDMIIKNLQGQELTAFVNGSGSVKTDDCQYQQSYYEVNGSGDIYGRNNLSGSVEATISGSGKIETTALTHLVARISGSGDIYYWGNPANIDVQVSGSGKVTRK